MPRPVAVTISFWLWVVAAGFAVATAIAAAGRLDGLHAEFEREARKSDASASADTVDRVADLSLLVIIGGGLLLGLLSVLLAAAMRAGKGWGRAMLVVVALLAVGYAVLVMGPMGWPVLVAAGVAVVAAVSMCLPESRPWFV
jgi:hypothetical protein